jgi:hypothetical protein
VGVILAAAGVWDGVAAAARIGGFLVSVKNRTLGLGMAWVRFRWGLAYVRDCRASAPSMACLVSMMARLILFESAL